MIVELAIAGLGLVAAAHFGLLAIVYKDLSTVASDVKSLLPKAEAEVEKIVADVKADIAKV